MIVDKEYKIGEVDKWIYGLFIEYMGCVVYEGIYELDYFEVDEDGFRKDVQLLIKELQVLIICYLGGNFLFGYNWEDGVGFVENCLRWFDLVW